MNSRGEATKEGKSCREKADRASRRFSCLTKSSDSVINYQLLDGSLLRSVICCAKQESRSIRMGLSSIAGGEDSHPSNNDDHSGVVQQAGHAALDRRIGVRIPAPEFSIMVRPHRLEAKDAALSRQKPEFESRWGHQINQTLPSSFSESLPSWCLYSVRHLFLHTSSLR